MLASHRWTAGRQEAQCFFQQCFRKVVGIGGFVGIFVFCMNWGRIVFLWEFVDIVVGGIWRHFCICGFFLVCGYFEKVFLGGFC